MNSKPCEVSASMKDSSGCADQCSIVEIDLKFKDPMKLFKDWYYEAKSLSDNFLPEALTLATVREDGGPSVRTVLLRGLDDQGFKMYWDHRSRKSKEIGIDSRGAIVIRWLYKDLEGSLGSRQIRMEGLLEKLDEEDTTDYFNHEPLIAKIRATACHQSNRIDYDRKTMLEDVKDLWQDVTRNGKQLVKPAYWGGYKLIPNMMEFYQGQRDSINDRVRFRKMKGAVEATEEAKHSDIQLGESNWVLERLAP